MSAELKPVDIELISPFPAYAWPRVWDWMAKFRHRTMDDSGPTTLEEFMQQRQDRDQIEMSWGVSRDGELGGVVTFLPASEIVGYAHTVFRPDFWGHHITIPALRQVADQIFEAGYSKIAMTPFADNFAIGAVLKKLGAVREGVLKRHTMRNGELVDMALWALFKETDNG